ncbi:hypothetical protein ALC57_17514, partial [Trachymyrmex cornetzi]
HETVSTIARSVPQQFRIIRSDGYTSAVIHDVCRNNDVRADRAYFLAAAAGRVWTTFTEHFLFQSSHRMRRLCIPPRDSSHTYDSSDIAAQLLGNSACLHLFAMAIRTNVPEESTFPSPSRNGLGSAKAGRHGWYEVRTVRGRLKFFTAVGYFEFKLIWVYVYGTFDLSILAPIFGRLISLNDSRENETGVLRQSNRGARKSQGWRSPFLSPRAVQVHTHNSTPTLPSPKPISGIMLALSVPDRGDRLWLVRNRHP